MCWFYQIELANFVSDIVENCGLKFLHHSISFIQYDFDVLSERVG